MNKFLGEVIIRGRKELVHIHDPGRLKGILSKGNKVLLERVENEKRKTKWDLIAGFVGKEIVFLNSRYHEEIAERIIRDQEISLLGKVNVLRREVKRGNSRFDFLLNDNFWIEVKGCTLVKRGIALFPDAPTKRGSKHIRELIEIGKRGNAAIIFLIFRKAKCFSPNYEIDPTFSKLFEIAKRYVKVFPLLLKYDGKWISYVGKIPLC